MEKGKRPRVDRREAYSALPPPIPSLSAMKRLIRPLINPVACFNEFGGISCWKDLTHQQHLLSTGFCYPVLQGLRRMVQQDVISKNLTRDLTSDQMSLSNVRFDIEFPRFTFPWTAYSIGTGTSPIAVMRSGFEIHTRVIIVDVSRPDAIQPWDFTKSPNSGLQPSGTYPRFYAPDLSYPSGVGGAPYQTYEDIIDEAGPNALLVCRDISNPDEVMPLPHNNRQGVRILSDKTYIRRSRKVSSLAHPTSTTGTITAGDPSPVSAVDLQTAHFEKTDFDVDSLKVTVTLPWYKRTVEYDTPLFVTGPESEPIPSDNYRSLLGETFICMESWIVPKGYPQIPLSAGAPSYLYLDRPASSMQPMPHLFE